MPGVSETLPTSYFQVYNLFDGSVVCQRKDVHVRPITALTFFNPLKYLITGAKDGTSNSIFINIILMFFMILCLNLTIYANIHLVYVSFGFTFFLLIIYTVITLHMMEYCLHM